MKLSSKDAIIKRQAVTINADPKQLKAYSHFSQQGSQDMEGREETNEALLQRAFAETLTDAIGAETSHQSGTPAGKVELSGADGYDKTTYEGVQAGTVPATAVFSGDNASHRQAGAYSVSNPLTSVQTEAQAILSLAQEEAEELIRDACGQAEVIISEAHRQEENMRETLMDSLLKEKLPQALEEGHEKGRQQGYQELTETIGKVQIFYQMMERAWHDQLAKTDEDLLDLVLKISERMVGTVLKYDKEKLLSMIRNLILLPNERRNLKIHVSDSDWEWLQDLKEKGLPPYPLVRDEGLQPGNILIQSNEGIFDAQLHTQLEKFREVLSEELINGQLESPNQ